MSAITLDEYIFENTVDDANEKLNTIIDYLERIADRNFDNNEKLKTAKEISYYYDTHESFLPGHIKWIFYTSKNV